MNPRVDHLTNLLDSGHKIMIETDLADLYIVSTKVLNQTVPGNLEHLPSNFMFQLSAEEKQEVIANYDHLAKLKLSLSLPNAFIEHGAFMPWNVLKSSRAAEISLLVMRTFVQIRKILFACNETYGVRRQDIRPHPSHHEPDRRHPMTDASSCLLPLSN